MFLECVLCTRDGAVHAMAIRSDCPSPFSAHFSAQVAQPQAAARLGPRRRPTLRRARPGAGDSASGAGKQRGLGPGQHRCREERAAGEEREAGQAGEAGKASEAWEQGRQGRQRKVEKHSGEVGR